MFTDNHIKLLKVLPTNILTPFWEFSKRILNKSFSHKKIDRTKSLSGRFFSINILNVYFLYLFAPFSWAEGVAIKWNLSDLLCSPTLCNIVTPSPSPASLSPLITIWFTSPKITKFSNQHLPNWEEHQWPQLFYHHCHHCDHQHHCRRVPLVTFIMYLWTGATQWVFATSREGITEPGNTPLRSSALAWNQVCHDSLLIVLM